MSQPTQIESLFNNLSWNILGEIEENMINLSEGLKINSSIQELNLNLNNLGANERNMINLSDCLKINTSIEKLNLGNNQIGEEIKQKFFKEFPGINIQL